MTLVPLPDTEPVQHRCDRWRRHGHDRLYVVAVATGPQAGPRRIGYRDLLSGLDHPTTPQDLAELTAVADHWEVRRAVPAPVVTPARARAEAQPA